MWYNLKPSVPYHEITSSQNYTVLKNGITMDSTWGMVSSDIKGTVRQY